MIQNDKALRLRDGRQLAYIEYGDPGGSPVMLFHGNPSSRLSWGLIPGSPFRPHLRLIAPDRPGFGRLVERLVYKMADVDRALVERREIREYLAAGFAEALRQGGAGSAHELVINHGRPWGFRLKDIEIGVHLWQGEEDPSVPPAMGRYLAATLPDCKATFIPGAGHLWIVDHVGEVLDALVANG